MSANWDLVLIDLASEEELNKIVSYSASLIELGNGMTQEWRFTTNNPTNYITYYMQHNLNKNVIIKIADDLVFTRMEYLMKIYKGYERSQGRMNWMCAINLINEYISESALLGEFEYRNFSGRNQWAEPRPYQEGQGFHEGYKYVSGPRRSMVEENSMPGYDWLFSNKLMSAKPCTPLESAFRSRQQCLLFGRGIPKPKEWRYENWKEDFLQKQGDKKMVEEHKPSESWLICSFLGLVSRKQYREFRIRYTNEMMNFVVPDMDVLIDEVHAMLNAREEISEYKFMWACIRSAVNIYNARYLYALFKQGSEALDRFEDENMNEQTTDWNESGPLENFYRYYNKTLHYETKIPITPREPLCEEVKQSGLDFLNQFKNKKSSEGGSGNEDFKSHALTEADIYPGETSQSGQKEQDVQQGQDNSGQEIGETSGSRIGQATVAEESSGNRALVDSTPTDKMFVLEEEMIIRNVEIVPTALEKKPILSYAKVVKKTIPPSNGSTRSESPKQESSELAIKVFNGRPESSQNAKRSDDTKEEDGSDWKQVSSKHSDNRLKNKKKNGGPIISSPKGESKKEEPKKEKHTDDLKRNGTPPSKNQSSTGDVSQKAKEVSKKEVPNASHVKNTAKSNNKTSPAMDKNEKETTPVKAVNSKKANLDIKEEDTFLEQKNDDVLAAKDVKQDSEPCSSNSYQLESFDQEEENKPQEPQKPTKTAIRKAKKEAAKARLQQQKSDSFESGLVEKLVIAAEDKSVVEANIDVEVQEDKLSKKQKMAVDAESAMQVKKADKVKGSKKDEHKLEDAAKGKDVAIEQDISQKKDAFKKQNESKKENASMMKDAPKQNNPSEEGNVSKKSSESKGNDEDKNKDSSNKDDSIKKELTPVEAVFTDGLATLYVENALLAVQGLFKAPDAPSEDASTDTQNDALSDIPCDTDTDTDEYIPGQKITYDYRPEVYPNADDNVSDSSITQEQSESVNQKESKAEAKNDGDGSNPLASYEADDEREIELANPGKMFPEQTCDPDLHDMFCRLKYIYDKQSTGGLRNFKERERLVIKKRLKTFMNVYIFRFRVAKAMLHILELDVAADLSGMRERSVIKNLCVYIGESIEEDSDTMRGRNLDRLTENIKLARKTDAETIIVGLRYVDLRLSELDTTDPLHKQYRAISDRVYDTMMKQKTLVIYLGGRVDYRGYKTHN